MFARTIVLSLASSVVIQAAGLQLDVTSQDSIKSTAKDLASSIIAAYNQNLAKEQIPGLFGKPYYFWETGAVFGGLIDYFHLTGDAAYNDLLSEGLQWQVGDIKAFMPQNQTKFLGNDDQSYWGLAAMAAAEANMPKPRDGEWVDYAANVFDLQALRYHDEEGSNGTCHGGLRWQIFRFNTGYEYKNSVSNGNFFLLAARLAKFTGNATYSEWAEKSYKWAKQIGFVSEDYHVFDGASTDDECTDINMIQWSNIHGSYTEGAAIMYNLTNGASYWADTVRGFANSSTIFLSDDILIEVACENNGKCDTDQRAFKGIAARSYARAALSAPIIATSVDNLLETSAEAAAESCTGSGEDIACSLRWVDQGAFDTGSAKDGYLGEVSNALAVVQALLYKNSTPPATSNSTTISGSANNATQSGGAALTEHTGSAGNIMASFITALIIAAAVALCQ